MIRQYHSFEEIDTQLKVLKLQREIYVESLKLKLHGAKANLLPSKLLEGLSGTIKRTVLTFAIHQLSKVFKRRRQPRLLE